MSTGVLFCRSNPVAPDPRVEREAMALSRKGYQVRVIGWDRTAALPLEERRGEVVIYREPLRAAFGKGMKNLIPLLRWQMRLWWWLWHHRSLFDVIHACDFDTVLPALLCKYLCKKSLVYDIFDFYADHARISPAWLRSFIRRVEVWAIEHADGVIVVDEQRKAQIQGADPKRLVVIYNTPVDRYHVFAQSQRTSAGKLRIVYVGLLQVARGLLVLLDVLKRHPEWHLDLAGFGGDEEQVVPRARALSNVTWHGRILYEEALRLTAQADVLLATYDPAIPNHRYASPNKLFEAMMLGKPIIVARDTHIDKIVEKEQCGVVVPYGDPAALEQALGALASSPSLRVQMGKNARQAYERDYSWSRMSTRLYRLYEAITL